MEQQKNSRSDDRILPEELELEILTRLPVKSLLRFRSVCKNWKFVITSYSLRKLHRQRHTSSPPLLITLHNSNYGIHLRSPWNYCPEIYPEYYLTAFDLHGNFIQKYTLPISSDCLFMINHPSQSKLFCFQCYDDGSRRLFSYNPSTRQLFRLPDPPFFSSSGSKNFLYILGYIPTKDEYTLVILVEPYPFVTRYCEVLTFSISNDNFQLHYNEWRSIEVKTRLRSCTEGTCFVNSVFYWEACDENDNDCILSFDIETEVFSTVRLPETPSRRTLLELKDELYVMNETTDSLILNLWKLCTNDKGNKSWTLYKTINLPNLGFTEARNNGRKFDWKIFIYRLEYLQCYNEPNNVLLEMGMLKLENGVVDADGEYYMPNWTVRDHTNLFTL